MAIDEFVNCQNLTLYSISNFNRLWRKYEKSNIVPSFRRKEEPGAIAEFDFTGVTMYCKDGTKAQFAVLVLQPIRISRARLREVAKITVNQKGRKNTVVRLWLKLNSL